jgi:hypothetical protein
MTLNFPCSHGLYATRGRSVAGVGDERVDLLVDRRFR